MKRFFFSIFVCSFFAIPLFAQQEVCNNGIDDDGDGFIDCFDKDCSASSLCDDSYLGHDASCNVTPGKFPTFTMTLDWESPSKEVTNHLNRVSIGDLDRDGNPEVVCTNIVTKVINILNGVDGSVKKSITVPYTIEREAIIANINNDNCAEIFTYGVTGSSKNNTLVWRIYAYDCNLNLLWSSPAGSELTEDPYYLSIADFDGDGKSELYYKDEIVDAHTGVCIVKSKNYKDVGAPVAIDILGDQKEELVAG